MGSSPSRQWTRFAPDVSTTHVTESDTPGAARTFTFGLLMLPPCCAVFYYLRSCSSSSLSKLIIIVSRYTGKTISLKENSHGENNTKSIVAVPVADIGSWAKTTAGYHRFLVDRTTATAGAIALITAHLVAAWSVSGRLRDRSRRTLRHITVWLPPTQRLAKALAWALLFRSKLVDAAE